MRRAFIVSAVLHGALITIVVLGLPRFGEELAIEAPITVELVAETSTNEPEPPKPEPAEAAPLPERQAASRAPEPTPPEPEPEPAPPEPEPPKPAPPKPAPEPPKPAPEPAPVPKPEPPAPEPEPTPEPEEVRQPAPRPVAKPRRPEPPKAVAEAEKKPEPEKVEQKTPEPPKDKPPRPEESDFASLLRSVEDLDKRVQADEKREGKGSAEADEARSSAEAPVSNLSASEIAGIKRQVEENWNVPVGVQGLETMQIELRVLVERDGSVRHVEIEDTARMARDTGFRIVAESAQRAVLMTTFRLPPEKYELWRDMVLVFRPADAVGG